MSKNDEIHISQGVTMKLISLGVALLITAGVITFFFSFLFALPVFYLGLVFFLSIKGAIFSIEKNQVKVYLSFFFFKVGSTHKLNKYSTALLSPYSQSGQFQSRASSTKVRTKSFDLYVTNKNDESLEIKEFNNYDEAHEAMITLSETFNLEAEDLFEEMMEGLQARRRAKERR